MFTYRIYVDGGHHVIATYENGTLLGEATYIIRSLEAIAGTGTTVTIRRVYNQAPVFANIPFADLRQSNNTQWGNNQANTITALNALLQAAAGGGAGTITLVNGDPGPIVVLLGTEINRNGSSNTKIETALISIESSVSALAGDVQTLFTIVGKPGGGTKTVVKDPSQTEQIEVTSATTKVNNVLLLTPTNTAPTTPPTGGMYMDLSGDLFISQSK
jgi:hypothetical protein